MTVAQEDALYEFLENARKPFTLKEVTHAVREVERAGGAKLASQIVRLLQTHRLVFETEKNYYLSRRALFEKARFVIQPSKAELLNGVLIPGHRCIPFANPALSPHEYRFYFNDRVCPVESSEGAPEDFYPFYSMFGEEYAPHYIAGDNKENETAFSLDPAVEPLEVTLKTVDMRMIFREIGFVPGDFFAASIRDWKKGSFNLEHVKGGIWNEEELSEWLRAAEKGFLESFEKLGPGVSCEEQIAWAYFFGGERMRCVPAYSLEDFLFQRTEKIETTPFGIESRFWWTGKEIPDYEGLRGVMTQSDQTPIEELLAHNGIPVSEFVLQSYVRDALFRHDSNITALIQRIVPASIRLDRWSIDFLSQYLVDIFNEFAETYSIFKDKTMGPVRQRVAELHTAVIDLAVRISKGLINKSWLPMHTFVVLSQIETHSAALLEDLDIDEELSEQELSMIDASLDSMIDTYEDVKELIDDALINFRKTNFSLVQQGIQDTGEKWTTVQLSLGGTDVWRRVTIPSTFRLFELQRIIHVVFGWSGLLKSRFVTDFKTSPGIPDLEHAGTAKFEIGFLSLRGLTEFLYEYGYNWTVKIIILAKQNGNASDAVRCIAGAGAAPNEKIEGPLRFRRLIAGLESGSKEEYAYAMAELGKDYDSDFFDLDKCNRSIFKLFSVT